MPDTLAVDLSRDDLHSLSVPESFETDRDFVVAVTNHGRDARVHCTLDGDLASVATIDEQNRHVQRGETVELLVGIESVQDPVEGQLTVQAGYGAETAHVPVTLTPRERPSDPLRSATEGSEPDEHAGTGPDPIDTRTLAVFAGVVVLVALGAAFTIDSLVVDAGAAIVVLCTLAGLGLALGSDGEGRS